MSRPTLAQKQALARYRELQAHADASRTAGQHKADALRWSAQKPRTPRRRSSDMRSGLDDPRRFWTFYTLAWAVVIGFVWMLQQPWFLAWRDGP